MEPSEQAIMPSTITGRLHESLLMSQSPGKNDGSNRASACGHPCARQLVYRRTRGEEREPFTPDVLMRLQDGNDVERQTLRDIMDAGFTLLHGQEVVEIEDLQLTGHIEGRIRLDDSEPVLFEIKSTAKVTLDRIHSASDLLMSVWTENWYAQIQMYMQAADEERALLILRSRGDMKIIECKRDSQYIDQVSAKLRVVNDHVAAGTLPDQLPPERWDNVCKMCPFLATCLPDQTFPAGQILDDPELLDRLRREDELKPIAREYESLKKDNRARFKPLVQADGKIDVALDEFRVKGQMRTRHTKARDASESEYCDVRITRIEAE